MAAIFQEITMPSPLVGIVTSKAIFKGRRRKHHAARLFTAMDSTHVREISAHESQDVRGKRPAKN